MICCAVVSELRCAQGCVLRAGLKMPVGDLIRE